MICALHELAEIDNGDGEYLHSASATALFLESCNLLFEQGILSHSAITSIEDSVIDNMRKGHKYFLDWYKKLKETG